MKKRYTSLLFAYLVLLAGTLSAQLVVDNTQTPAQLAQLLTGPGVQILNPQVNAAGGNNMYGKYNATNSNLNITEGLLLTTGTINNAVGPNNVGNKTSYFGSQNTPNTYPLLNNYTGRTVWEYCEFEFDIIPQGDTLKFDFVFASEEYEEWVGSQYNDVFGFFISGPGITPDPGAGVYHNIALLPNGTTPVTINNVNQNSNTQYYQNNNNGATVQYDGFTKGLRAISSVQPCQTYHLKLVVADCSDKLWDSGVFIEKITSNNILLLSQTAGGIANMVEGCNNGTVTFTRQNVTNQPLTITYWIAGTATNGTDYPLIGSSPSPASPKYITIPANQPSASIAINPFADGIPEPNEYVGIYLGNPFCSNSIMDSLRFYIMDSLWTTVAPPLDSICIGSSVQITTTGGGSSFSWSPASGLNNASIPSPFATPTVTTTYTLTTTASTCIKQKTVAIRVSNIALAFSANNVTCNGANNGSVTVSPSGGFPPYTYSWTGPSSYTATTATISGLSPGQYTVTVTGRRGCSQTGTVSITQPAALTSSATSPTVNGGWNISCNSGNNGTATVTGSGGVAPYTYSWSTTPVQTMATASGLTAGTYTATVRDANNCTSTATVTLSQPSIVTAVITAQTNVLCFGNNTGSATVTAGGGTAPYTYSWSTTPAQSTPTASNLAAGTYTVTVRDANNCTTTASVTITQPSAALTASISAHTNVLCRGNSTGSATVAASGGTGVYTYSWNTTPVQTTATAINLSAGSYVVVVQDANNCTASVPVTITQPASNLTATSTQTNVLCFGNNTGAATVSATGGTPGYTYLWSTTPAQTTASATGLTAGTYTCTVRDANNCSFAVVVVITQPAAALSASIPSHVNVLCFGNNTGAATAAASGGVAPYTYSWSTTPAQTTATATGLTAGTYSVTIRDANNCSSTATVSITQPGSAVTANLTSQTNVLCFGGSTGAATVSASGGVGSYTYLWTPSGQTTATASGLIAGTYTCIVRDANNCSATVTVSITQPASALTANITASSNVMCFGNATGSALVTAGGGSGSYSYSWNSAPVQTSATASGLPAGNYTVTVSDNNGCTIPVTRTVTITQPSAALSATASSPVFNSYNISCNGGSNGSITLSPAGGTTPYTYSWSGPSGYSSSSQNVSALAAGSYNLLMTDANGCTMSLTQTLTEPPALAISSLVTNATCPAFTNGAIDITVTGGTPAYSYAWSGPAAFSASTEDISGRGAGSYTIIVTDANGCTSSNTITIAQPSTIVISGTPSSFTGGYNVSCNGGNNGAISTSVTGGTPFAGPTYLYSWTGPSGFTSSSQNINTLIAGTYQLLVTDAAGCNASYSVTLTQPAAVTAALSPVTYNGGYNITCNGASTGSITLTSSGGTPAYSYAWNGPSFTSSSQNISSLTAGNYTVIVTDVNSCTGTASISLTQPAILTAGAVSPAYSGGYNISCNGLSDGTVNLTAAGGTVNYSYLWTGPSSYSSVTEDLNGVSAGSYSVTVTDANGCTANTSITLTEPAVLSVSAFSPTVAGGYNITCNGATNGSIALTAVGGTTAYTYAWSGPSGYSSAIEDPSGVAAGSYSVIVTDANSCTASTSITLTQPNALTASATSPTVAGGYNITCNGTGTGNISLTVNGGTVAYTYAWTGPSYTSVSQNPASVAAGTYSVVVTDANGCTTGTNLTLTEPNPLATSLSVPTYSGGVNITCNGASDGTVNLSVTGGTSAYSYLWNGPSSYSAATEDISGLTAGMYSVLVTDQNGCTSTASTTLTEPALFNGSLSSGTYNGGYNISCQGNTDGNITLTLSGGTMPYTYNWSNSVSTQNQVNIPAGLYTVIASDANNCTFTQSITLSEPAVLTASATSPTFIGGSNIDCNGNSTGSIDLGAGGGTTPYVYSWAGPSSFTSTSEDITGLLAGTYSVIVTDNNGCTATVTTTLTEPAVLATNLTASTYNGGFNISCNGNGDGSVQSVVTGGTITYTYAWTGPSGFTASTSDISQVIAGSYSVVITDVNGCTANSGVVLTEPAVLTAVTVPAVYAGGFNISCNGLSDGVINTAPAGGAAPYNYAWSGPNGFTSTNQNLSGLAAGTYSLTLSDANGCSFTITQQISEPASMSDSMAVSLLPGGVNITCNGAMDGTIDLFIAGGATPYSQLWNGPSSFTSTSSNLSGLDAGQYNVTITDANGCQITDSTLLIEPSVLITALTSPTYVGGFNTKCSGDSTAVIYDTISGGTAGYQFAWTGPGGFTSAQQSLVNVPSGTYNVNVTDTNGCMASASIVLTDAPAPLAGSLAATTYPSGSNIACTGTATGSIDLTFSGGIPGYIFWWRGPNLFTDSTEDISGLYAGLYDVVVTDTNGCNMYLSVTLTEPAAALNDTISASVFPGGVNIHCFGGSDGTAAATVTGGSQSFTYSWTGPNTFTATTPIVSGLTAGMYYLTVTDTNNCTISDSVFMSEPAALTLSDSALQYNGGVNVTCNGSANGSIDLFVSGGVAGYQYSWTGPSGFTAISEDISNLAAGIYNVTVTDTNNCAAVYSDTLIEPSVLTSNVVPASASCASANGSADLTVNGGVSPYGFAWSNGDTSEDISSVTTGTYTVIITDANGCLLNDTVFIDQYSLLAIGADITNVICYGETTGGVEIAILNGTGPFAFAWSNGATTQDLNNVTAGSYSVNITDGAGCVLSDTFFIDSPQPIITVLTPSVYTPGGFNISAPNAGDGSIDLLITGGFAPYSYSWSNGDTTQDIAGLGQGEYLIVITDSAGCTASDTIVLIEPLVLDIPNGISPNGDGLNDAFVVHGIEIFPDNELTIYNRWGNVVYTTTNYQNDWRGTGMDGNDLPDGTYFVVLEINNKSIVLKDYIDVRR